MSTPTKSPPTDQAPNPTPAKIAKPNPKVSIGTESEALAPDSASAESPPLIPISQLRVNYFKHEPLHENLIGPHKTSLDPYCIFNEWMLEARSDPSVIEPNAMVLSTVSSTGFPHARYVLLIRRYKKLDQDCFLIVLLEGDT